jgi:hypothetical protein
MAASSVKNSTAFISKYFLVILLLFGVLSLVLNAHFINMIVQDASILEINLKSSLSSILGESLTLPSEKIIMSGVYEGTMTKSAESDTAGEAINEHQHHVAGLNCEKWGGPSPDAAKEMVYWEDIPSDAQFISPFHKKGGPTQYVTFEPDQGGWNNIRMAMETLLVGQRTSQRPYLFNVKDASNPSQFRQTTAFAMGRTVVLPPRQSIYLLGKKDNAQRNEFSFDNFFHMESIGREHPGFNIITMENFLQSFMGGRFKHPKTGTPLFPPENRTDWNGVPFGEQQVLKKWLRESANVMRWDPNDCIAAFPRSSDPKDAQELVNAYSEISKEKWFPKQNFENFVGKPLPVDASPKERMRENWAERKTLCLYGKELQDTPWVHFPMDHSGPFQSRMLVHFYAFLFFADWKTDLWTKRFIRDHVRYVDEIQCAAARVVNSLRRRALEKTGGISNEFDTLHVRRGDFQYKPTRVSAKEIYEKTSRKIFDETTVYIATDERDKSFFNLLKEHYDVVFLDEFTEELKGLNTNYYGMVDQLVASRGRIFFGCWFSTFTGYINRLRGYHADDHQTPGFEFGVVPSYYYALSDRYLHMQTFYPVKKAFYAREFPASWRLIDTGLNDTHPVFNDGNATLIRSKF